jgi:hypothetical protein
MSAAFDQFRFSFFEDRDSPRNGLDTAALARLEGEERSRAEEMLLRYLPDTRGVIGLGVLRSRKAERRLVPLFEAAQREQNETTLVHLAKALWQIRPDPRWLAALIEILASSDGHIRRMKPPSRLPSSAIPRRCARS